jgi:plasmid stability protein
VAAQHDRSLAAEIRQAVNAHLQRERPAETETN